MSGGIAGRRIVQSEAARVASELRRLLGNPCYAERAAAVGARVQAENGASAAADALEKLLRICAR